MLGILGCFKKFHQIPARSTCSLWVNLTIHEKEGLKKIWMRQNEIDFKKCTSKNSTKLRIPRAWPNIEAKNWIMRKIRPHQKLFYALKLKIWAWKNKNLDFSQYFHWKIVFRAKKWQNRSFLMMVSFRYNYNILIHFDYDSGSDKDQFDVHLVWWSPLFECFTILA